MLLLLRAIELPPNIHLPRDGVERPVHLEGEVKLKIPKQEYTAEFKGPAVKRVKTGRSIRAVARELSLVEQTLHNGVKAAEAGRLNGAGTKTVTAEQKELSRLRAENIRVASVKVV